jgi:hypothetical protein
VEDTRSLGALQIFREHSVPFYGTHESFYRDGWNMDSFGIGFSVEAPAKIN